MSKKRKANGWKIFGIGLLSLLLLGGLGFGTYKLVQHVQQDPPATEETEQETQTPEDGTETTPEEEIAAATFAQFAA